jgi:hypothetical protein
MDFIATLILVTSIIELKYQHIERCYHAHPLVVLAHLHLIAFTAMGGAAFIGTRLWTGTGDIGWLTFGMLSAITAATLWVAYESIHVFEDMQ